MMRTKLSFLRKHLRLRPFDSSSAESRAAERYRLALLSMVANVANRVVVIAVMMLSVSWTLPYLGEERFGAWMTIASFVSVLSFMDLGIGNSLSNRVSQSASKDDIGQLGVAITGGLGTLGLICLFLLIVFPATVSLLPWAELIKVNNPAVSEEVRQAVVLFFLIFPVSVFAGGLAKVFQGLQKGFVVHLTGIAGSLLSLLALRLAVINESGIPVLIACTMGVMAYANLVLVYPICSRHLLTLKNCLAAIKNESGQLIRVGGLFFILQIGTVIGWGADSFILASTSGAAAVAVYSIAQRLFQFVSQPLAIVNGPLWNAYADADARNDRGFVKRTFLKSIKLTTLMAVIGALVIFVLSQPIIQIWIGNEVVVPTTLLFLSACWVVLESSGNALGVLLNGLGIVRQQVVIVSLFVAVALPLKIWLASSWGASGVVLAGVLAYTLTTVLGYGLVFRRSIVERIS